MSRLRQSVVSQLIEAHNSGAFTKNDFSFTVPEAGHWLFCSSFKHEGKYTLLVTYTDDNGHWRIRHSPGRILALEDSIALTMRDLCDSIKSWTSLINEDLRASSISITELDAIAEKLNKEIKAHIKDPHLRFSPEEAKKVKEQLDQILAQFDDLKAKSKITDAEMKAMRDEIEQLKINADHLKKGVFFATTSNKLKALTESRGINMKSVNLIEVNG